LNTCKQNPQRGINNALKINGLPVTKYTANTCGLARLVSESVDYIISKAYVQISSQYFEGNTPFVAFSGMMWNAWGLIIVGGVYWDAATSIRLRNAEDDHCVGVVGETVRMSSCRAGNVGQSWLWEGKRARTVRLFLCSDDLNN
jgi:hypothetical protein